MSDRPELQPETIYRIRRPEAPFRPAGTDPAVLASGGGTGGGGDGALSAAERRRLLDVRRYRAQVGVKWGVGGEGRKR